MSGTAGTAQAQQPWMPLGPGPGARPDSSPFSLPYHPPFLSPLPLPPPTPNTEPSPGPVPAQSDSQSLWPGGQASSQHSLSLSRAPAGVPSGRGRRDAGRRFRPPRAAPRRAAKLDSNRAVPRRTVGSRSLFTSGGSRTHMMSVGSDWGS